MFTTYCNTNSCIELATSKDQSGWICPICGNLSLVSNPLARQKFYTHAGLFHADEVTAYAICNAAGVMFDNHTGLHRLTNISEIPEDGIVADIGRQYNADFLQFDHHQSFIKRIDGFPFATAGLIWKHFGLQAVERIISSKYVKEIADRVDEVFIKGIDAHDADNDYSVSANCSAGKVRLCTISNAISCMNYYDVTNHAEQHIRFIEATDFVTRVLIGQIQQAKKFIEAKHKFAEIAEIKFAGKVIVINENLPWREIVHEQCPEALFVISPSNHPGNPYSLTSVSTSPESRDLKKQIERPGWFTGFIHQGKWIAGGESIEQLENLALENI